MKSPTELHLPGDLSLRLEREIDRDRRYEARRPDRRLWCRRLGKAERQVNEIVAGERIPDGMRGFVVVHKIAPGTRIRCFFYAPPDFDPDMSEAETEALRRGISSPDGWGLVGPIGGMRA